MRASSNELLGSRKTAPMMDFRSSVLVVLALLSSALNANCGHHGYSRFFNKDRSGEPLEQEAKEGTRWAVLFAGSRGYWNYRHQADVCHAYQVLKEGGLKDENIIVFMYDDIAHNSENPKKGTIINRPDGPDVYKGVPKDYTGDQVTRDNLFAVLLGNSSALSGGSGKVVKSGPNDHIFVYYSDHGGPGVLGAPVGGFIHADQLIEVLKEKHSMNSYRSMLIYLESCESGSIFEGMLDDNMNIYATTAANADEDSWGTYCDSASYNTCLGDEYSVSWLEDSDVEDLHKETLEEQFELVKERTWTRNKEGRSHVMQYGNLGLSKLHLDFFIGTALKTANGAVDSSTAINTTISPGTGRVRQREADLVYFRRRVQLAPEGSSRRWQAQRLLDQILAERARLDESVLRVSGSLFGLSQATTMLKAVREPSKPLVDSWQCLRDFVSSFERYCGPLKDYGMRHMGLFANVCNAGIGQRQVEEAFAISCKPEMRLQL